MLYCSLLLLCAPLCFPPRAADLLLHVRDIHSDQTEAQREDVYSVLSSLGLDPKTPIIEVCFCFVVQL